MPGATACRPEIVQERSNIGRTASGNVVPAAAGMSPVLFAQIANGRIAPVAVYGTDHFAGSPGNIEWQAVEPAGAGAASQTRFKILLQLCWIARLCLLSECRNINDERCHSPGKVMSGLVVADLAELHQPHMVLQANTVMLKQPIAAAARLPSTGAIAEILRQAAGAGHDSRSSEGGSDEGLPAIEIMVMLTDNGLIEELLDRSTGDAGKPAQRGPISVYDVLVLETHIKREHAEALGAVQKCQP